jgi:hypothetical protein
MSEFAFGFKQDLSHSTVTKAAFNMAFLGHWLLQKLQKSRANG